MTKPYKKPQSEKQIEKSIKTRLKARGWKVRKNTAISMAGVLDVIAHKNGMTVEFEVKRVGNYPTDLQYHEMEELDVQRIPNAWFAESNKAVAWFEAIDPDRPGAISDPVGRFLHAKQALRSLGGDGHRKDNTRTYGDAKFNR